MNDLDKQVIDLIAQRLDLHHQALAEVKSILDLHQEAMRKIESDLTALEDRLRDHSRMLSLATEAIEGLTAKAEHQEARLQAVIDTIGRS